MHQAETEPSSHDRPREAMWSQGETLADQFPEMAPIPEEFVHEASQQQRDENFKRWSVLFMKMVSCAKRIDDDTPQDSMLLQVLDHCAALVEAE